MTASVKLRWLAPLKAVYTPVSFGTPWAQGCLRPEDTVALTDDKGQSLPVQTKINAYWPDGSVKWLLHSAVLDTQRQYTVSKGVPAAAANTITAEQADDGSVAIESGLLQCALAPGGSLISTLIRRNTGQNPISARLLAYVENRGEQEDLETVTIRQLTGWTERIVLEENGPLRVVVKLEGRHQCSGGRQLFPFVVRLYFYAQSDQVKLVHSFVYDGDQHQDFLKGVAVQFQLQAEGNLWNRHVGFAGDTGMFYEAVQPMYGRWGDQSLYVKQQLDGEFVDLDQETDPRFWEVVNDNAFWSTFRLLQHACDHYSIVKRTKPQCALIPAAFGNRSQGAVFFGDPGAILAVGVRDFWQKYPMALEVDRAAQDDPRITVWLWSKYSEAFDFRAYDTVSHKYSYGGIDNHPEGIANTNEITVKLFDRMPGKRQIFDFALDVQADALLVADPETYQRTKVFGTYWCPPDPKYQIPAYERALLVFIDFYINEVEQRRWYSFWDYGDVMHTYDPVRHCWRYDVGGYAWQNTELCPTYVNWLAFLRTGDYRIYRFARAMARHTSEVDIYHSGKYAMLGTRHNVRHWGCGAKEPRISMAGHHRFFYYLTGDERIGDVMDFVKDADFATLVRDPMRNYFEHRPGFAHIRTGPDWSSFVSNWMTRWERFNDTTYRDKILAGLDSIKKAPNRLASGSTFLYSPEDNVMRYLGEGNYQYHMVICFGGPEIWFELADLLQDDELRDMLAEFGEYYALTPEERKRKSNGLFNESNDHAWRGIRFAIRMVAYAGYWRQDPDRMRQALELLEVKPDWEANPPALFDPDERLVYTDVEDIHYVRPIREVKFANTNGISQWSLNYMETAKLWEMLEERRKK